MTVQEKIKKFFSEMAIKKSPEKSSFFSAKSIPSFLRDWIIMRFSDSEGNIDFDLIENFLRQYLPDAKEWNSLKGKMTLDGERVKFLTKVNVEIDVNSGLALFQFPLLGFPKKKFEAIVDSKVLEEHKEELLTSSEVWGVVECVYRKRSNSGAIYLVDYKPFRPYRVDLYYYQEARRFFEIDEWIDLILLAVDYNPLGFLSEKQKLTLIYRLLPFVEERLNLIELAPKGTGKSYMMSQISKYGWLISGGIVSRAKLFYDLSRKTPGLVTKYDYIAFDEIQTISFSDQAEIAGALKGYLESGECRVGAEKITGRAGIVIMGNIEHKKMSDKKNVFEDLPSIFSESALLDRFHGFIRGWDIPRMKENMKAEGWALNVEYFSEILHALRDELNYSYVVDEMLEVPKNADHRDTVAIKRICTGLLKLLFPHVRKPDDISPSDFEKYCLEPAKDMRLFIRNQLHKLDPEEYSPEIPDIRLRYYG